MNAALCSRACIVRASIIVVAHNGRSSAYSVLAKIGLGAGSTVEALDARQRLMRAAVLARATILCARIAIVACGLIDGAIAVVVHPIAQLHRWSRCVTSGQPIFAAQT